jgi:benzaldehyde dehydrogenase (NAD)
MSTTVNDLPQCPMGGLGQSGNGSRFGSLNSRDEFTEWQWLTVSGSAALYPMSSPLVELPESPTFEET